MPLSIGTRDEVELFKLCVKSAEKSTRRRIFAVWAASRRRRCARRRWRGGGGAAARGRAGGGAREGGGERVRAAMPRVGGPDAAPCAAIGGARRRPLQNSQRVLSPLYAAIASAHYAPCPVVRPNCYDTIMLRK